MSTHQSLRSRRAASLRQVAVFGCGLIGASIALRLRRSRPKVAVLGIDRRGVLARARSLGIVDEATSSRGGLARLAARPPDLVVLALPVGEIIALIPRLADICSALPAEQRPLILDVGSVKGPIVAAAQSANCPRFVGGHPMAGVERGGVENAHADLFDATNFALCPVSTDRSDLEAAKRLVTRLGARSIVLDAASHDRVVALMSHLPHLAAWGLIDAALELEARLAEPPLPWSLAGGSWADATRVAASDPRLWTAILEHNRDAVAEALDLLIDRLARIRGVLGAGGDPLSGVGPALPAAKLARLARRRATGRR